MPADAKDGLRHLWHPFTQAQTATDPVEIRAARGSLLVTADGREIIDLISSWWVNVYGHCHPRIVDAIQQQAAELEQVIFAGFTHQPAIRLATALARMLPGELNRVFFSDDGSTAVEVALKIAYQHYRNRGVFSRQRLLAFDGGYHGDTFGAMAAGRASGFFEHWGDLLFEVETLEYPATWWGDSELEVREDRALQTLGDYLERFGDETFAMILEPLVQGAGGMRMVRPAFLNRLVARLREWGILVIFDEVMTGFGRTGTPFACQQLDVVPDLICLSKGLTGGFLPLSVTVASDSLYESFLDDSFDRAFAHGHSFTANPIGCAAALASVEILQQPETAADWARIERAHRAGLERLRENPRAKNLRQSGTIGAFDVDVPDGGYTSHIGPHLKQAFLQRGLLIRPLGNVLYLLPPYCTSDEQLDIAWRAMDEVVGSLPH